MYSLGMSSTLRTRSASTCWKCDETVPEKETLFCGSCGSVQPIKASECDLFALFDINQTFDLDLSRLETSFKGMQKRLHPDKFATKPLPEQQASATASSTVNQSYQILRDPVERARYILQQHGSSVLDEGGDSMDNPTLMMDIFAVREEVADAEELAQLVNIEDIVRGHITAACVQLQESLDGGDAEVLPTAAVRLKYYAKALEEIEVRREELEEADV